jgi:hypothetical protein
MAMLRLLAYWPSGGDTALPSGSAAQRRNVAPAVTTTMLLSTRVLYSILSHKVMKVVSTEKSTRSLILICLKRTPHPVVLMPPWHTSR